MFNSIGIGFGSLIAFSSYNKFKGPLLRDTIIVTLVDAGVSLVCGLAVFSVLGNLAHQQGQHVKAGGIKGPRDEYAGGAEFTKYLALNLIPTVREGIFDGFLEVFLIFLKNEHDKPIGTPYRGL